jgi:peptidoglycan/xylan/chitin deacetylase (PgdA/CDA1 family)
MAFFRPLILCYHAVSDAWEDPLATTVADFESQLQRLVRRGFRGGTVADVVQRPHDRRLLHVTFDDAFASVANVVPILAKLGLPATIFVCSDFAATGQPLLVTELQQVAQVDELATLTWDDLRSLAATGVIEIGSHSASHAHLTGLSDDELRRELGESRTAIEDNLGRPCTALAYPYGEHDARVRDATRAAGYSAAFAAPGFSRPVDLLQIPRTAFWRNESALRQSAKTRFAIRTAREHGLTPTRRSAR